ncbi:unnamed protein product [Sphagnum compactum]
MEVKRMWDDGQEGEEAAAPLRMLCRQQKAKKVVRRIHSTMSGLLTFALFCTMLHPSHSEYASEPLTKMGINYGQVANDLPSDADAVKLIKSLGAGQVKIYNTDSGILTALANTGLDVVIAVDNSIIPSLAASASTADEWIVTNVVAYPSTSITVILVGNEVFSTDPEILPQLVPAIQNLQTSLTNHGLTSVALSTACELSILSSSYPPSAGVFEQSAVSMLTPLLEFLDNTSSYLYINAYPYFAWASDPSGGTGANTTNAEAYNNNLVKFILSGVGTPKRPQVFVPTYVFALFNEDLKPGAATEQHWGLFYPNGTAVYSISLAGSSSSSGGSPGGDPSSPGGSGGGSNSNPPGSPDVCGDRASVLPLSVTFVGMLFNLRI